jgi:hypothetical protein
MRDIRYKWNEGPNSVGVSEDVSLPQFKVLGHRQRAMEISLTTGRSRVCRYRTSAFLFSKKFYFFTLSFKFLSLIDFYDFCRYSKTLHFSVLFFVFEYKSNPVNFQTV